MTATARSTGAAVAPSGSRIRYGVVVAAIFSYAAVGFWTPAWRAPELRYPHAAALSIRLEGWRAQRTILPDREYFGSVAWTDHANRIYTPRASEGEGDPAHFEVLVLVDDRLDRTRNILSTRTARARPGLRELTRQPLRLSPETPSASYSEFQAVDGLYGVIHWRSAMYPPWKERLWAILGLDQSGFHRNERGLVVRVATRLDAAGVNGHARRRRQLRELASEIERAVAEAGLTTPRSAD